MRLFPDAAVMFIEQSGSCNTRSSKDSARRMLHQLQSLHPGLELHQFETSHLTQFCLGHAPNTMKVRRSRLRSFFDWATYHKLVKANPATDLKYTVKFKLQNVRDGHWLTEAEVGDVFRATTDDVWGRRARLVLMAGFMMGLRREEISRLRWSMFSKDLSRLGSFSTRFVGKGDKLAHLGVPAQFRAELSAWREQAPPGTDTVLPWILRNADDSPEFHWDRPMGDQNVGLIVDEASRRSGIKFAPHDMRRSYAGILEEKGVSIADISRLLRHSDIGVTSRYLEKNPHKTAKLADSFSLEL